MLPFCYHFIFHNLFLLFLYKILLLSTDPNCQFSVVVRRENLSPITVCYTISDKKKTAPNLKVWDGNNIYYYRGTTQIDESSTFSCTNIHSWLITGSVPDKPYSLKRLINTSSWFQTALKSPFTYQLHTAISPPAALWDVIV